MGTPSRYARYATGSTTLHEKFTGRTAKIQVPPLAATAETWLTLRRRGTFLHGVFSTQAGILDGPALFVMLQVDRPAAQDKLDML
jgi:hypothetical protein